MQKDIDSLREFLIAKSGQGDRNGLDRHWDQTRGYLTGVLQCYEAWRVALDSQAYQGGLFEDALSTYRRRFSDFETYPIGTAKDAWMKELLRGELKFRIFEWLISPEYEAPDDAFEIFAQLNFLLVFYTFLVQDMPPSITARIGLAMARLMFATASLMYEIDREGRKRDRGTKSGNVTRAKSEQKRQLVYEIYHKDPEIRPGMKLSAVARAIEKTFEKWQNERRIPAAIKRPKTDQIKRFLMRDEKIQSKFKKEGPFIILQR